MAYCFVDATELASTAAGDGAGLVGFEQSGAGAIARTLDDELRALPLDVRQFGAVLDGETDDTAAFQALATQHALIGGPVNLGTGTAIVSQAIRFQGSIFIFGDVAIDASAATVNTTNFPLDTLGYQNGLMFDGGDLASLPALASDAAIGDQELTFASTHGLTWGDTITARNTAAGSFHGLRTYYYDGEHARVAAILSSTQIMLDRRLRSVLPSASTVLYKRPGALLRLAGKLRYRLHTGVRFRRLDDSLIDGLRARGGASACIAVDKCFGLSGNGLTALHEGSSGGTDYGVVMSNSQGVYLTGKFRGRRHAFSPGGDDTIDSVPCRDFVMGGEFSNDITAGVPCVGIHGNCEDYRLWGIFHGGVILAGDRGEIDGEIYNVAATDLYTVTWSEMKGFSFRVRGRVYSTGNPNNGGAGRGVINLGGGETASDANTTRGGVIRLDCTVSCPNADRPIVMRNRGATPTDLIGIDFSGLKLVTAAASPVSVFNAVSGDAWDRMWFGTNVWPTGHSFSGVNTATKIKGWAQQGTASVTTSTSASKVTVAAIFSPGAPKAPIVFVDPVAEHLFGGKVSIGHAESITFAGFTAALRSVDQANWTSAVAVTLQWRASLDE